jgi:prophage DNA circulation protein
VTSLNSANDPAAVVSDWCAIAARVATDATSLLKMVGLLQGSYGRYAGGRVQSFYANTPKPATPAATTVADLAAQAAASRAAVAKAIEAAISAATGLTDASMKDLGAAIQAVAAAVAAAIPDPGEALRLLPQLADFFPAPLSSSAPLGQQHAATIVTIGDLCRRAAATQLGRASASFQPASQDDAESARDGVVAVISREEVTAADEGANAVYQALRALRVAVTQDLGERGAQLPEMASVTFATSLPSFVLASRLYRDSTRADELVAEANPIHPGFMPLTFQALTT